ERQAIPPGSRRWQPSNPGHLPPLAYDSAGGPPGGRILSLGPHLFQQTQDRILPLSRGVGRRYPPIITVVLPDMIAPPQPTGSPIRAAINPPMYTVSEPFATGKPQAVSSVTRAACRWSISTLGQHGATSGLSPSIVQTWLSVKRAAGGMVHLLTDGGSLGLRWSDFGKAASSSSFHSSPCTSNRANGPVTFFFTSLYLAKGS